MSLNRIKAYIPLENWWQQTLYIHGSVRLTRCTLNLGAADRDGDAHVDPSLSVEYESLMKRTGKGFFSFALELDKEQSIPITDAPLVYIRQIVFEVLNSPDVPALAK